eukprot:TRINITY_DN7695_c0_g1_i1.p1 TRINITY_DN7695_c0_g1~~TRINITY_DN7695_c0_g1_i1.p1  ORF type:complete len:350 (+),score=47.09 TRINITY_DN7695_c0_g1_i1:69-1118(+)
MEYFKQDFWKQMTKDFELNFSDDVKDLPIRLKGKTIKVNLPRSQADFETGNGEGCHFEVTNTVGETYETNKFGGIFVGILNNEPIYPQWFHLRIGDPVVFQLRGVHKRPVAYFDQLKVLDEGPNSENFANLYAITEQKEVKCKDFLENELYQSIMSHPFGSKKFTEIDYENFICFGRIFMAGFIRLIGKCLSVAPAYDFTTFLGLLGQINITYAFLDGIGRAKFLFNDKSKLTIAFLRFFEELPCSKEVISTYIVCKLLIWIIENLWEYIENKIFQNANKPPYCDYPLFYKAEKDPKFSRYQILSELEKGINTGINAFLTPTDLSSVNLLLKRLMKWWLDLLNFLLVSE